MRHKHLLASCVMLLFFCVASVNAQSGALKAAKKKMESLDYMGAIQAYNQILKKNDAAEAKINLAECYRKVSDVDNAEFWYGQVVRLPEAEPVHYLNYGYMLMRNNKCDMALEWFQKYVQAYPDDVRGQHLLRACDLKEELLTKNAGIYETENMPFNTGLDDFGPAYFGDGLVYASESGQNFPVKRLHCWTGNPFLELYHVERTEVDAPLCDYEYGDAEKFSSRLNSKYHDAAVSFAEDNSEIFFTRNNLLNGRARKDDEGIIRLKIYSAEGNGGSGAGTAWSNMESLPFNSDEYSVAHPALTPDGQRLYFASDMPGGFGGMDLYVSEKENERWGPPLNLGPAVNTEGHEVFPFYAKDNKLYFASDGQVGLGGLDLFFVEKKEAFNEWGEIINMGAPINSEDDDFGLIMNEERTCGYFTSDREGGKGDDDIYSFRRNAATVKLLVYDEKTKEPIEGAEVVSDCTGNTVFTDKEGIAYVDQKLNQCCNFTASKEEYNNNEMEGCTTGLAPGEETIVEIPLNKSVEYMLSGVVTDARTGQPIPDAQVVITDCNGVEEIIMTDASGFYATTNLTEACCVSTSASKSGYAANSGSSRSNLCPMPNSPKLTANMTLDNFLAPTPDNPIISGGDRNIYNQNNGGLYDTPGNWSTGDDIIREAAGNEPIECCGLSSFDISPSYYNNSNGGGVASGGSIPFLLHIYYDFDQSYIRDDAISELEKLYGMLTQNPNIVVEIGSHTDSRGSHKYNDRLSQRRAESVVRWLKDKGIPSSQLQSRGYGETMNMNNCANNVPCSEQEHQLNRRTEFRVVGLTDGTQYSQPRNDVSGKECQGCPF